MASNLRVKHEEADIQQDGLQSLPALPIPYQLLALAVQYQDSARHLAPHLARRPDWNPSNTSSDQSSQTESHYDPQVAADLIASYRRYISAAIICLRRCIDLLEGGPDVKVDLLAKSMLAEILIRETHGGSGVQSLLTKGMALASRHNSTYEYRFRFLSLQVELAISDGNIKFAKSTVKKCIQELSAPSAALTNFPVWLYRFHFLGIHIAQAYEKDNISVIAALHEIASLAIARKDTLLEWTCNMMIARTSILQEDIALATSTIHSLARPFGLPLSNEDMEKEDATRTANFKARLSREDKTYSEKELAAKLRAEEHASYLELQERGPIRVPRGLLTQFLVLLSIYQAYMGEMKVAKQTIKRAHVLLDASVLETGEEEGWVEIDVHTTTPSTEFTQTRPSGHPHSDQGRFKQASPTVPLIFSILPRPLFYAYTFLVSTIVQVEPNGKNPKCMLYANAGLETLLVKVNGLEVGVFPKNLAISGVVKAIRHIAGIQADLLLCQSEYLIMRSAFEEADKVLADAITFVRANDLWATFAARISLINGLLYQALGDLEYAFRCFTVAFNLVEPRSPIGIITRISMLFIRISQGHDIRISEKLSVKQIHTPRIVIGADEDLVAFSKDILEDCRRGVPSFQLLGVVVESLVLGELVKAKACLTLALNLCQSTNNQYMKPLILSLLSCYFLHTRNDQAEKMLHSAFTCCRAMNNQDPDKAKKRDAEGIRIIGVEAVGQAKLGLWNAQELLALYERDGRKDRATKQRLYIDAHMQVLDKQKKIRLSL